MMYSVDECNFFRTTRTVLKIIKFDTVITLCNFWENNMQAEQQFRNFFVTYSTYNVNVPITYRKKNGENIRG